MLVICTSDALLTFGFKIQIRLYSTFVCRFHTFLAYFLSHMSSVVLAIVSIDRVFVVYNNQFKFFKKNYIEKIILIIFIILGVFNIHYLIFYNLIEVNNTNNNINNSRSNTSVREIDDTKNVYYNPKFEELNYENISRPSIMLKAIKLNLDYDLFLSNKSEKLKQKNVSNISEELNRFYVCYPSTDSNYVYFLTKIWIWIDSAIYSFLPIVIMMICSCFILLEIRHRYKNFTKGISSKLNKILAQKRLRRSKQILFMLTGTNAFFILCSLPYCIIYHKSNSERTETDFSFSLIIVYILSYSNNSFNFVFYGLFSERYKEEISVVFSKLNFKRRKNALKYNGQNQLPLSINNYRNINGNITSIHRL